MLADEFEYAEILAEFLSDGYNRGKIVTIAIGIDGEVLRAPLQIRADDPLVEYLAQWACSKKLRKGQRLEEFDKQMRRGLGSQTTERGGVGAEGGPTG